MALTETFAGNLTGAPEQLHTRHGNECVACCVAVTRRTQNQLPREWAQSKVNEHNLSIHRTAANHIDDSTGRRGRVLVHGALGGEACRVGENCQQGTRQVVVVEDRAGEVGRSMQYGTARLERQTDPAATTENRTR